MWPFKRKQKRIEEAFRQAAKRCLSWTSHFSEPMRFRTEEDGVYIVEMHLQGLIAVTHRMPSGDMHRLTATNKHYTIAYGIAPIRVTQRKATGYTGLLTGSVGVLSRKDTDRFLTTLTELFNELPDFKTVGERR